MKTVTKSSKAFQGRKKTFDAPIPYEYSYEAYETYAEIEAAKDLLKDKEVVKARNNARAATARSLALNEALDAAGIVKPTLENDPQMRLREMFKIYMATKEHTEETARAAASAALNLEWDDEDED